MNLSTIQDVSLIGYTLVTAYCRQNHLKGGTAIYKHDKLSNEIECLNSNNNSIELLCEMAGIKISMKKKQALYVLGVYRPPAASIDGSLTQLAKSLEEIPNNNCGICILGDININSLVHSRENTALNELLASFNILRMPLPPTRVTTVSATSIDMICSNLDLDNINVKILQTCLSDHSGQICIMNLPCEIKQPTITFRRHLKQENLLNLTGCLESQSWERVYSATSAEEAYYNFIGTFTAALDVTCPLKKSRYKKKNLNHQVLSNPEVAELRTLFCEAQEKYLLSANEEDKIDALQKKKTYDLKLKTLRKEANQHCIFESENKCKAIWDVINGERASKKKMHDVFLKLSINEEKIEDLEEIAEHFNNYFINAAEIALSKNNSHTNPVFHEPIVHTLLLNYTPTTVDEINKIITSLKPKTSSGTDGISSKILKFCKNEVIHPITNIVNKSLTQGVFPTKLKVTKVHPLHKQGSREDLKNFRPISLVPTISKVIEKVVLSRLLQHLDTNNLMPLRQHGFISGKSTTSALIDLIEHLIDNLEAGKTVSSIFLDLSKAFDSLDHSLLISKISSLGIRGTALKWFADYLHERKQLVEVKQVINGTTTTANSKLMSVKRGVPQGSVLGPVLFVLFNSDFPNHLGHLCYPVSYADDTVLITNSNLVQELEANTLCTLDLAQQYCLRNDLVFNASKTKYLTLGKHRDEFPSLPNLERVHIVKHLGVIIDDHLSWNYHIDSLCKKLSSALFVLRRIKSIGTDLSAKTAYHALFETHICYGVVLRGGASAGNLQRVLIMQKCAVRIMANLNPRDSCREAFKTLGIPTVVSLYIIEVILHAYKLDLPRNNNIHEHQTRHANDFNLSAHRTTLFTKKPSYSGAELYNMLPRDFKGYSPPVLKKMLTNWLVEESIYNIEEFKTIVNLR